MRTFETSSIPHICTQTWHVCLNPYISDACLKMCHSKRRNLKAHLLCNASLTMPYVLESDPPFIALYSCRVWHIIAIVLPFFKTIMRNESFFASCPHVRLSLGFRTKSQIFFIFPISGWTRMGMLHDGISFICKFIKSEPANSFLLSE